MNVTYRRRLKFMPRGIAIFFLMVLSACQQEEATAPEIKVTTFSGQAMTLDYQISIGKELDAPALALIEDLISATFSEVNAVYNKYNPASEVSRLNQLPADVVLEISPELEAFLEQVGKVVELTGGRFDPTIEPLQKVWKGALVEGKTPSPEALAAVVPAVGWHHLHIKNGRVFKDHAETSLDLGGIAKGLCVDMLTEKLNQAGYPDVFVEWGGEVRASGEHPEGREWRVGIRCPPLEKAKEDVVAVALHDQAFATSGDYIQYWKVNRGVETLTYCHIFNPKTHAPVESKPGKVASASVLASNCVLADGIATAAMLFETEEEATKWLEKIKEQCPEMEYWLMTR